MNSVVIFYISCFNYSKLWRPFLKLREKYLCANKIKLYLCTDKLPDLTDLRNIENEFDNIKILEFNEVSYLDENYFKRYLYYLENIKENLILYMYDDMFPSNYLNYNYLMEMVKLLNNNDNIKLIKTTSYNLPINKNNIFNKNYLVYDNKTDNYIISSQVHIIKKNIFINLINYCIKNLNKSFFKSGPNIYEFMGTQYFRNKDYICLTVFNKNLFSVYYNVPEDYLKNQIGCYPGIVSRGTITQECLDVLKKKENIIIKTYENNMIFELTEKNYNNLGDYLKEKIKFKFDEVKKNI